MAKLDKMLNNWVSHELITSAQAKQIRAHQAKHGENPWILSGILILGAVIIGIGVISLVAANWDQIPDAIKLAVDFGMLGGLSFWILQALKARRRIQYEVLLVFYMFVVLASVGLISQVYNLGGELYQAFLFWSVITFGVAIISREFFVPFIWAGGFLNSLIYLFMDAGPIRVFFNQETVYLTVSMISAALLVVSKVASGESGITRAFRVWTLLGGLFGLAFAEIAYSDFADHGYILDRFLPVYILAVPIVCGILLSKEFQGLQKALLLAVLGLYLLAFHLPVLGATGSVIHAIPTIGALGAMAIYLASLQYRRLFQGLLALLGLRFLVLYFQAIGGLALTGIGLILSGGVVIGMAVLWNKYRVRLGKWAERWAK